MAARVAALGSTLRYLSSPRDIAALLGVRKDFHDAHRVIWSSGSLPELCALRAYSRRSEHARPGAPICGCCALVARDDFRSANEFLMKGPDALPAALDPVVWRALAKFPADVPQALAEVLLGCGAARALPMARDIYAILRQVSPETASAASALEADALRESLVPYLFFAGDAADTILTLQSWQRQT